MTRAKSPLASGEAISALVACEPADSPAIVTLSGSPPKAATLRLNPLQRGDKVEKAVGAGRMMFGFGGEFGMGEEAQRIEPMVDGDDDNAARGKTRAVVARLGAGADDEAAAVNPDHHRQARAIAWSGRRPNVQMQAILGGCGAAEVDVVPHDALHGMRAKLMCRPHACPGRSRLRRAPTQSPDRRRGIGDAFVNADAACIRLRNRERAALDRQTVRHQTRHPALVSTGFAA